MSKGILLAVKQLGLQQSRFIRLFDIVRRSVRVFLANGSQREKHAFRSIGCHGAQDKVVCRSVQGVGELEKHK
jgi:hypothetical protein